MRIIADDIDFGDLELFEIEGRQFLMSNDEASRYGFKKLEMSEPPKFLTLMKVSWYLTDINQVTAWAMRKEDVQALAKAMSLIHGHRVAVSCMARILIAFQDGNVVSGPYTLNDFYDNIEPELLEETRI